MCLYPRLIENRKYRANIKNGGIIPPINDQRVRSVPVGCEQCIECRKQKARAWQVRLLEDIKTNTNGKFITLTFSNESLKQLDKEIENNIQGYDRDNAVATLAIRRFVERWRKTYKKSIRHWLVTEIGHKGTENIHMHGIIWTDENLLTVENIWKYGFIWKGHRKNGRLINYVNARTTSYIAKYIHKIDIQHKTFKSKVLTSPGIGANYINTHNAKRNKYNGKETNELYITGTGHQIAMPIYWRNKIYNEKEREQLWLNRLDKQERWICGEKIDISQNEIKYYKLLEHYRTKNHQLGYGNNEKNWKRAKYEEERRKILQAARIKKGGEIIEAAMHSSNTGITWNQTEPRTTSPSKIIRVGYG